MATARRAPARTSTPARPAARGSSRSAAPAPRGSSGYSGAEGRAKMLEEAQKAEARKAARAAQGYAPFRFFMAPGETKQVIVVDEAPNFFRHEHQMKGPSGRWDLFLPCIAEHANCPACEAAADKQPYFAMYLTIIDLTPYENSKGDEIPWSKKLLVVKPQQQKKMMRIFEREGTLRGALLSMTRDGDKDASIGNEIEFEEFVSEDELASYVDSYQTQDNKTVEVIGDEPYDYDEIFPELTEEEIAASVGGRVNNRASHERNVRDMDRDDWGGRDNRQSRSRPAARGGRNAEEEEQEEAPPRRAARSAAPAATGRPASRPAPRRAAQQDDQEAEDDDQDDAQEEAPPPRRAAGRTAAAPAPSRAPARRSAPAQEEEADDQDDAQDDPPQRRPSTLADRRAALRRGR